MSIYQKIAEKLQFVAPGFYKERYFKKLKNLSEQSFLANNVEPELFWIKDFLERNAVFFDIGANVGAYLYQLENKLAPQNVYAFEPNRELYRRLRRIFPHHHVYPLAISDENKTAEFKIPVINGKVYNSRGTLQTDFVENGEKKFFTEKVKVIKLDDWAGLEGIRRIDFIKIDVEGNEIQTLYGAKNVIKKFRPVLMVEMEQRHHQKPLQEMIAEIENWNYTANFLNRENFTLQKIDEEVLKSQNENLLKDKNSYINNIIFIPNQIKTH